jgi:hypothetical protein
VGKTEGTRPLGRPRLSCGDNIKMDLTEIVRGRWTGFVWVGTGTSGGML